MKNKFYELLSLDRHFVWADYFRKEYYHLRPGKEKITDIRSLASFFLEPVGMNMCYWYASLYVVIEGLEHYPLDITTISSELNSIKDCLRLFRNVIYHHQPMYFDKRLFAIMNDPTSRLKIKSVHDFLDTQLRREIQIHFKDVENSKSPLDGLI